MVDYKLFGIKHHYVSQIFRNTVLQFLGEYTYKLNQKLTIKSCSYYYVLYTLLRWPLWRKCRLKIFLIYALASLIHKQALSFCVQNSVTVFFTISQARNDSAHNIIDEYSSIIHFLKQVSLTNTHGGHDISSSFQY